MGFAAASARTCAFAQAKDVRYSGGVNRVLQASALLFFAMACKPSQDASVGIAADGGSGGGASDAAEATSSTQSQETGVGGSSAGTGDAGTDGPQVLYQRAARPQKALEVDETHIYWNEADGDGLRFMAAPKDGSGPVETLGEWSGDDVQKAPLATDSESVYWRYDTKIIRLNKATRTLTEIDVGSRWGSLLVDEDALYTSGRDCAGIILVNKETLEIVKITIPNGGGGSASLTMDRDDVICSHGQFIHAISKKDRSVRDIARDDRFVDTGLYGFGPVASDGETLFWLNLPPTLGTDTESLERRRKAGGSVEVLAVFGRRAGSHLRFDAARGRLYTIAKNPAGTPLLSYSIANHELQELATKQPASGGITFDSKYIYWTLDPLEPAGVIMRMKAPEGS